MAERWSSCFFVIGIRRQGGTGNAVRDLIDLGEIDANPCRAGNNAFAFLGTGAFTDTRGQLRYSHANGDTIVEADVTGEGAGLWGAAPSHRGRQHRCETGRPETGAMNMTIERT